MKPITRICPICSTAVLITKDAIDYIYTNKRFAHIACFSSQKSSLSRGAWTEMTCQQYIDSCRDQTLQESAAILNKHRLHSHIDDHKKYLNEFYDYLKVEYDLSVIPKYFFIKIASIENGTHKNLTKPIPVTHLLEMFVQGKEYLKRTAIKAQQRGLVMHGIDRVNYDLAVLLNKYDSFLAKKQQIEKENEDAIQRISDRQQHPINRKRKQSAKIGMVGDLSSIIDEI